MAVAVITNGKLSNETYRELIEKIKIERNPEVIVALMEGDYYHEALGADEPKADRSKRLMSAGFDVVMILPVYSVLMEPAGRNFANLQALQRLNEVKEVIFPYREEGDADWEYACNIQALMKSTYSPLKAYTVKLGSILEFAEIEHKVDWDGILLERLQNLQREFTTDAFMDRVCNTIGGFDSLADVIRNGEEDLVNATEFCAYAKQLTKAMEGELPEETAEEDIRSFLIKLIAGYRRIDHSVSGMYSYAPFLEILDANEIGTAFVRQLKPKAWIRVYEQGEGPEESDAVYLLWKLNESMKI